MELGHRTFKQFSFPWVYPSLDPFVVHLANQENDLRSQDQFLFSVSYSRWFLSSVLTHAHTHIFGSLGKFQGYREDIKDLVTDTITYMHKALQDKKNILVEGANATMLDIDFGGCTSQECSLTEFSPSTDQGTETHYAGLGCVCFEQQQIFRDENLLPICGNLLFLSLTGRSCESCKSREKTKAGEGGGSGLDLNINITVNKLLPRSYLLVRTLRLCLRSQTCVRSIVTTELVQTSKHMFCGEAWLPPLGGWHLTEKMMNRKWKKVDKGKRNSWKWEWLQREELGSPCADCQKDQSEVAHALSKKAREEHSVHSKHIVKATSKL